MRFVIFDFDVLILRTILRLFPPLILLCPEWFIIGFKNNTSCFWVFGFIEGLSRNLIPGLAITDFLIGVFVVGLGCRSSLRFAFAKERVGFVKKRCGFRGLPFVFGRLCPNVTDNRASEQDDDE